MHALVGGGGCGTAAAGVALRMLAGGGGAAAAAAGTAARVSPATADAVGGGGGGAAAPLRRRCHRARRSARVAAVRAVATARSEGGRQVWRRRMAGAKKPPSPVVRRAHSGVMVRAVRRVDEHNVLSPLASFWRLSALAATAVTQMACANLRAAAARQPWMPFGPRGSRASSVLVWARTHSASVVDARAAPSPPVQEAHGGRRARRGGQAEAGGERLAGRGGRGEEGGEMWGGRGGRGGGERVGGGGGESKMRSGARARSGNGARLRWAKHWMGRAEKARDCRVRHVS